MKKVFTLLSLFVATIAVAQPLRAVVFTGNAATDFKPVEKVAPTGFSYTLTWDGKFVYIGVTGTGGYVKDEPTILYIDTLGQGGRDTGFDYDGRRPILPFTANAVVYFKNGYAELRRDTAGGKWGNRKVVTDSVKTSANSIEIKLPWSLLTGKAKVPATFGAIFFKTNGNGDPSQQNPHDAYEVRPGVGSVNETYTTNVQDPAKAIKLYFKFTTENKIYTALNMLNWIANKTGDLCAAPSYAATPETNKTQTSVKLNWTAVAGAKQYQVHFRQAGTTAWKTKTVPGTVNYTNIANLLCGTSYNWCIRELCDTAPALDVASALTAQRTFATVNCFTTGRGVAPIEVATTEEVSVYPVPARKGSAITVASQLYRTNSSYTIYSVSGQKVQQGTLNSNKVNLANEVVPGNYIIELRNNASVTRTKLVITQ